MNIWSFPELSSTLIFDREALMTGDTIVAVTEATGHIETETIIVTGHVCVCVKCVYVCFCVVVGRCVFLCVDKLSTDN